MMTPRPIRAPSKRPLRIAQLAGIAFRVPPRASGGTELVIDRLPRAAQEGVTGWIGATTAELVGAVGRARTFDRARCRDRARVRFGHRRMAADEALYLRIARRASAARLHRVVGR